MRNSKLIVFGLLVMFLSAGLMACGGGDTAQTNDKPAGTTQPAQPDYKTISLYKYQFNPANLTIQAGTTVMFSNKDPDQHNVSIPALNLDVNLGPDESFEYTFDTLGEFAVSDRFATSPMKMTIVVQ